MKVCKEVNYFKKNHKCQGYCTVSELTGQLNDPICIVVAVCNSCCPCHTR